MNKINKSTLELPEKQNCQCSYGPTVAPTVETAQAMPETDAANMRA